MVRTLRRYPGGESEASSQGGKYLASRSLSSEGSPGGGGYPPPPHRSPPSELESIYGFSLPKKGLANLRQRIGRGRNKTKKWKQPEFHPQFPPKMERQFSAPEEQFPLYGHHQPGPQRSGRSHSQSYESVARPGGPGRRGGDGRDRDWARYRDGVR